MKGDVAMAQGRSTKPMAQGRSTKIISMIKWIRASRLVGCRLKTPSLVWQCAGGGGGGPGGQRSLLHEFFNITSEEYAV